jgi:hypothetical protein
VGGNNDFSAEVTGAISSATGSFDSATGVTSETGTTFGPNCSNPVNNVANTFSLQLNTKPFATSVCSGSPNPQCQGWQQFLYSNDGIAFVQYWLLKYNAACPAGGWNSFSFPGSTDIYCYRNSTSGASVPVQTVTSANIVTWSLTGSASGGGNDTVTMTTGSTAHTAPPEADSILNLASGWQGAEFIIVGDACGSQANFNAGSTIVVRTTVHNGTTNAPACVLEGFTGETNNLSLVGTPAVATGPSPAIVSKQSNVAGTTGSCAAADGVGDTHLTTFSGLLYDFQATGDFLLAQSGPDFLVQTRQVSGAPTWPNASVNKAVATRMGKSRIAVCRAPDRLVINGKPNSLASGKSVSLPDGVDISRDGNTYLIRGPRGDSVRAVINNGWMNVFVGLGQWPANVRGLLANPNGNVNEIETSTGTVLKQPVSFEDLYGRYGASWRIPAKESLLMVCGESTERGNPKKPFYAADLDAKLAQRTLQLCQGAGVKGQPLLDACTLDTAVLGRDTAAGVFVEAKPPVAELRPRR